MKQKEDVICFVKPGMPKVHEIIWVISSALSISALKFKMLILKGLLTKQRLQGAMHIIYVIHYVSSNLCCCTVE